MNTIRLCKLSAAAIAACTVIGCSCVNEKELDAVRTEAAQAKVTAQEARTAASAAEERSRQAESRAQLAEEAVSRGFKKSMRK